MAQAFLDRWGEGWPGSWQSQAKALVRKCAGLAVKRKSEGPSLPLALPWGRWQGCLLQGSTSMGFGCCRLPQ
jgi:hypothetical protein